MEDWNKEESGSCIVCGNPVEYTLSHTTGRTYGRCNRCRIIQIHPRHILPPKEEQYRYNQHENSLENQGYVEYLETFADHTIRQYLDPPAKVLDFGSGPTPVFGTLLKQWGYEVTLYDPYFAPQEDWRDFVYSGVTSIEVFEHLRDPLGTLTALSNCITPGGYIFLRTLLHYDDAQRFRTWWYPIDETHITFYHEESLKYLADQCNLSLLSVERGCEIILQKQK